MRSPCNAHKYSRKVEGFRLYYKRVGVAAGLLLSHDMQYFTIDNTFAGRLFKFTVIFGRVEKQKTRLFSIITATLLLTASAVTIAPSNYKAEVYSPLSCQLHKVSHENSKRLKDGLLE
jgi:hypothetical protein